MKVLIIDDEENIRFLFCNEMGVGFTKYLSDFRLK